MSLSRLLVFTLTMSTTAAVFAQATPVPTRTPFRLFGRQQEAPQPTATPLYNLQQQQQLQQQQNPEQQQYAPQQQFAPSQQQYAPAPVQTSPPTPAERAQATRRPQKTEQSSKKTQQQSKTEKNSTKESEKKNSKAETNAEDSPTSTVGDFLLAAHQGSYSKAKEYLTPQMQRYFDSELSILRGNLKSVLDEITRDGEIARVTYSDAVVRGEGAMVVAEIEYSSGQSATRRFDLIREKDNWRIILPITAAAASPQIRASQSAAGGNAAAQAPAPPAPEPTPTPAAAGQTPADSPAAEEPRQPSASAPEATSGKSATVSALADAPWRNTQ